MQSADSPGRYSPHAISESASLRHRRGDAVQHLQEWLAETGGQDGLLVVEFRLPQYWLEGAPELPLTALYCLQRGSLWVSVTDQRLTGEGAAGVAQYQAWLAQLGCARVDPSAPMRLLPVSIPKPWGQEIWFSGVEARGVCQLTAGGGASPIPWLQAVLPGAAAGSPGEPLVLLKILDPSANEVEGDLYFELHEQKREVYVVTHVDETAWPEGTGFIRYGFDPARLARYPDEEAFRQAYLASVLDYEAVRREIDDLQAAAGADLLQRESQLREKMNGFTHLRPLRVGDVVKVPLRLPHSLQHGVRTIEFQTPVYERKILSFAQKVLTQDHWDTREAVAQMLLTPPPGSDFELLADEAGRRVERIVDFSDFQVERVVLAAGARHPVAALARYALVMVVSGSLLAADEVAGAEQALLLPRHWRGELTSAEPAQPVVFLLATPRV